MKYNQNNGSKCGRCSSVSNTERYCLDEVKRWKSCELSRVQPPRASQSRGVYRCFGFVDLHTTPQQRTHPHRRQLKTSSSSSALAWSDLISDAVKTNSHKTRPRENRTTSRCLSLSLDSSLQILPETSAGSLPPSCLSGCFQESCRMGRRVGAAAPAAHLLTPLALSGGRLPVDGEHAPPWFMSHLSRLMFPSPQTGCSRLVFGAALHGRCLGAPRSVVIKLRPGGRRVVP